MSDPVVRTPTDWASPEMSGRLKARYTSERRFRLLGLSAVSLSALFLVFLLFTMTANSLGGFTRTEVKLPIDFPALGLTIDPVQLQGPDAPEILGRSGLQDAVALSAQQAYGADGDDFVSNSAWADVRSKIIADPSILKQKAELWVAASDDLSSAARGEATPELAADYARLDNQGDVKSALDAGFLTRSDATDPGQVGIWGALKGSMLTMLITLALAFPIGVLSAIYLEEMRRATNGQT